MKIQIMDDHQYLTTLSFISVTIKTTKVNFPTLTINEETLRKLYQTHHTIFHFKTKTVITK